MRIGKIQNINRKINNIAPSIFLLPALLFILVFSIFPILFSFGLSFTEYNLFLPASAIKFNGFENYINIVSNPLFYNSVLWTFIFTFIVVLFNLLFGFLLALILTSDYIERKAAVFKTFFIIPLMAAPVVIATIWRIMFVTDYGVINNLIQLLGFESIKWLTTEIQAKAALIFIEIWFTTPFSMLIFIGALKTIPKDVIEAAYIDGANEWATIFKITLPLIKSFIAIIVTIRVMDTLRIFDLVYVFTNGGPGTSTETIGTVIYKIAFRYSDIGAGSAGAFIFLVIIAIISFVLLKLLQKEGY